MTYLVLARKWRPRSFDTLVGQDHVVRALTHALSTQRLHHAWLFTGTRGVGKTTLSRILAKSLNCHSGVTASPCGECAACTEIDAGRFVDYIELDAASNRGVDEMTQLLEQAVYSPASGRFKVYMIDEVHMLSGHAFNAMLKTLEEPPPHVKFILATTDPQKIPATVLSRCLQFNLKQMTAESIISYLEMVLQQESVQYDVPALRLLAHAASGSMRDALSLTDQAIAYSAGNLTLESVQGMLGTIDQGHLIRLVRALGTVDATGVISVADDLAMRGLSYSAALADLAVLLSRIAIEQRIPGSVTADDPLCEEIRALATGLHPDIVQLFYSVAVHSRHELSLAPDEYAGFVMACLRMLSLIPEGTVTPLPPPAEGGDSARVSPSEPSTDASPDADRPEPVAVAPIATLRAQPSAPAPEFAPEFASESESPEQPDTQVAPAAPTSSEPDSAADDATPHSTQADQGESAAPPSSDVPPWEDVPFPDDAYGSAVDGATADEDFETLAVGDEGFETSKVDPAAEATLAQLVPKPKKSRIPRLKHMTAAEWPMLVEQLPLTGVAAQLARQSEWLGADGHCIRLRMAIPTLAETSAKARFRTVLSEHFGSVIELDIEYGATGDGTAHAIEQAHLEKLQKQAEQSAKNDPFVNVLISDFGGQLITNSIRAVV